MITFAKKERGGVSVGSPEAIHIFRDPPKSIHTRKKERINQGDVNYMVRENQDRISENILQFPRGVNPMVGVSYNTHGGGGSTLSCVKNQPQAHNAYKVDKKFVPPIFRQEDLLPLSRQRRDLFSLHSKIVAPYVYYDTNNEYNIDYEPVKKVIHINPSYNPTSGEQHQFHDNVVLNEKRQLYSMQTNIVMPNKTYETQTEKEMKLESKTSAGYINPYNSAPMTLSSQPDNQTIQNGIIIRPSVSVSTNAGVKQTISVTDLNNSQVTREIIDQPLRSYLPSTFNVAFYQPHTEQYKEVELAQTIKEQIAVDVTKNAPIQIYSDGDKGLIKLKEYNWTIHRTNAGNSTLIIETQDRPELYLGKNTPAHSVSTHMESKMRLNHDVNAPTLDKNTPAHSVTSHMEAKLRLNPDVNAPILDNNRPIVSINALPNAINFTDNLSREYNLPPTLNIGGFSNSGTDTTMYSTQNYNPITYNKRQSNKDFIKNNIRNV